VDRNRLAGVSGEEQVRRARQSAADRGLLPDEQDPEIAQAMDAVRAVNLDEVTLRFVDVMFIEWHTETVEGPDTEQDVRRVPSERVVHLCATPTVEQELDAIELFEQRAEMSKRQQLDAMTRLVLGVWQLTEPAMTVQRLRAGLSVAKIVRLFMDFFGQTTRR